jgi:hypothetical protein
VEFYVHLLGSPNSRAKVLFALTASHGSVMFTVVLTDLVQTLAFNGQAISNGFSWEALRSFPWGQGR